MHLTDQPLISIWGTSAGNVFAVGYQGTILHYDGSGWAAMSSRTDRNLIGVWGSSANNVLASGGNGTILRYNGASWAPMDSKTEENLGVMWGTSGQNIYVTGNSVKEGYHLFHYNGSAWSKILTSTDVLYGVWGTSANDVYVVGDKVPSITITASSGAESVALLHSLRIRYLISGAVQRLTSMPWAITVPYSTTAAHREHPR